MAGGRRWLAAGLLIVAALAAGAGGAPLARAADGGAGRAWITIGTTRPGLDCRVDVAVEVRAAGGPVAGLPVQIAFSPNGADVASVDEGTTDADGIVRLAFDTGSAEDGASGWLDVNIDGAFAKGASILPRAGGSCSGDADLLEAEASVAGAQASSNAGADDVGIPGIPAYKQARSLSCEYASVYIATSAFGDPIPEEDYIAETPQADNPHSGYRGDIDGVWGRTDDYGIYAEALVPNLEAHGYVGEVAYDPSADYLKQQLDAGRPVVVWIATRGDTGFYEQDADGNSFKLVPYEHVVVAYGYDAEQVYVSDPGSGIYDAYSWDWFLEAWNVLDGMSLAISPAS